MLCFEIGTAPPGRPSTIDLVHFYHKYFPIWLRFLDAGNVRAVVKSLKNQQKNGVFKWRNGDTNVLLMQFGGGVSSQPRDWKMIDIGTGLMPCSDTPTNVYTLLGEWVQKLQDGQVQQVRDAIVVAARSHVGVFYMIANGLEYIVISTEV